MNRILARPLGALLAVTALTLVPTSASATGTGGDPTDGGGATPPTTDTGGVGIGGDGGGDSGEVEGSNCFAVAGPSYMGLSCGSVAGGSLTVKEVLDGDPVPDCWHEKMTAAELEAFGLQNTPGDAGSTWHWERCLEGVDPKTKTIGPEGVSFTFGYISIDNRDEPTTLTENQELLVTIQGGDGGVIPAPIVATSPSATPRVGADVSFFDPVENEVSAQAGNVTLTANVTGMWVEPLGEGMGDGFPCQGAGYEAQSGETPSTTPGGCWYRYEKSSAGQSYVTDEEPPKPAYGVMVTEEWTVTASVNGGDPAYFTSFTKSQVNKLPVTEIQSLVIR